MKLRRRKTRECFVVKVKSKIITLGSPFFKRRQRIDAYVSRVSNRKQLRVSSTAPRVSLVPVALMRIRLRWRRGSNRDDQRVRYPHPEFFSNFSIEYLVLAINLVSSLSIRVMGGKIALECFVFFGSNTQVFNNIVPDDRASAGSSAHSLLSHSQKSNKGRPKGFHGRLNLVLLRFTRLASLRL